MVEKPLSKQIEDIYRQLSLAKQERDAWKKIKSHHYEAACILVKSLEQEYDKLIKQRIE